MARHAFNGVYQDGNGRVVPSGTVSVFLAGTSTAANIYTASTGGSVVNSVTGDSTDGSFVFYIDEDTYDHNQFFDIVLSKTDFTSKTISDVIIVHDTHVNTDDITRNSITVAAGTVASPSVKVGDEENGLSSPSTNQLAISVGGGKQALFDLNGNHTIDSTLDAATGNEVALDLQYITNKATSGNDTGLVVNQTDTASPGTSYLVDLQSATVSKFSVTNGGAIVGSTITVANGLVTGLITATGNNTTLSMQARAFTVADNAIEAVTGTTSNTSGQFNGLALQPTYNQTSGTASNTDLLINRTETAVGSGAQLLADFQVGGTSKLAVDNTGMVLNTLTAGITADTGSSQGDGPLTSMYNEISVCANAGDAVTLPSAVAGYKVTIINNGAQACDVFPASSDNAGAGADTAVSLAAGANITYFAFDVTNWESI